VPVNVEAEFRYVTLRNVVLGTGLSLVTSGALLFNLVGGSIIPLCQYSASCLGTPPNGVNSRMRVCAYNSLCTDG
jgi:hypothetical protein